MIKMYVPAVKDQEGMLRLIKKYRLIPFFVNPVPGFSVEEHTPSEFWFTEEHLGPWDWKIDCVQSGDIAYGKFLYGGKAAFATVDVYREIINWRRSLPKYRPNAHQQKVLEYLDEHGSVSVPEVRELLGINKAGADASSFCTPEALFEDMDFPFPGYNPRTLRSSLTPAESLEFLKETIRESCGDVPDKVLMKILG